MGRFKYNAYWTIWSISLLGDNASQYAKVDSGKDEVEVDIEKYIKLQYNYLKNTKKINLATSTVKFAKGSDNKWQVTK